MRRLLGHDERGGAMVWMMVASSIILIGLLAALKTVSSALSLRRTTYEQGIAEEAAVNMVEELLAADFDEVFERYNGTNADNPTAGTSPGGDFAVASLSPADGDSDGMAGEILFPVATGAPGRLTETPSSFPSMPRDINIDGDANDTNVTSSRKFLPVRIVVRWKGGNGESTVEYFTVLAGLD